MYKTIIEKFRKQWSSGRKDYSEWKDSRFESAQSHGSLLPNFTYYYQHLQLYVYIYQPIKDCDMYYGSVVRCFGYKCLLTVYVKTVVEYGYLRHE